MKARETVEGGERKVRWRETMHRRDGKEQRLEGRDIRRKER